MRKYFVIIFIVITKFSACSSGSKDSFLKEFDSFVSQTSQSYKNFKNADWATADKTMEFYTEQEVKKWESQFTVDDSKKYNQLVGQYKSLKIKDGVNGIKKILKNAVEETKSIIDEVSKDSSLLK